MSDELIQPEKKVGIGAYISLIFACVFFSGAFASNHWWGIFDFITLNGTWGKVVQNVTMNDAGALRPSSEISAARGDPAPLMDSASPLPLSRPSCFLSPW